MIDAATFNHFLWDILDKMGWLFWLPFVGYGIGGLILMYKLAPAATALGRLIRVIFSAAFMAMIFTPTFNGLGPYIFHAVTVGMLLTIYQLYLGCKAAGLIKPSEAPTVLGCTVETMIDRRAR
jgi:hypothetical protein